jgi:lipid-binding SYLF domain-containing protein
VRAESDFTVRGKTQRPGEESLKNKRRKYWTMAITSLFAFSPYAVAKNADATKPEQDRLENAGRVMQEIVHIPDDIPQDLMDKARCVVVMPSVLKAAFVFGGSYGRGVMVCRTGKNFDGPWGAPAMYALEGGSFGLQIGGEATDFVFLILNDRGANSLLHSKVRLGADASAAAGPVGRSASADTDAYMRTEILSYSRARGVFAGVSLEGSTLRPDKTANHRLYGEDANAAEIVAKADTAGPPAAYGLVSTLQNTSPQLRR